MKQRIICHIAMLLLAGNIAHAQHNTPIDSLIAESQHCIEQEMYEEALTLCRRALSTDSVHPGIYNQMGIAWVGLEEYDSARVCYQKAIDMEPRYVWAYYNMGVSYSKQEKYELAIPWLEKAAGMYKTPDWVVSTTLEMVKADLHYQKGLEYEQQGKIEKAIKEWKRVMKKHADARIKLEQYGHLPEKYKRKKRESQRITNNNEREAQIPEQNDNSR